MLLPDTAKNVAKRYKGNKYDVLHIITFENDAYKNTTMPFYSLNIAAELHRYRLILKT